MTSKRITDRQRAVIDTMRMHLRPKQGLQYLKENGHPMAESTLTVGNDGLERQQTNDSTR